MRGTRTLLFVLAGALAAGPAFAQSAGTVELGAFGRWTRFADTLGTDLTNNLPRKNGFGGGLRFGIFLVRNLEVEADASYAKVDAATAGDKVRFIPIHAGLTYNFPIGGKSAFFLGGRFVHNMYGEDADFNDNGIGGVAGFRFGPVRIAGTWDQMLSDNAVHGKYHNLGVEAGLSLLLGGCNKSADGITISPGTATLDRGATATFTATSTHCGKPHNEIEWSATGGTVSPTGEYTAGQTPGSYQVTATDEDTKLTASASVTIKEPPPPPPPPPVITLSRIDLRPDRAKAKLNESVAFTVTGIMSDNSSKPLDNCPLTADGNATRSGNGFSWGHYGTYTVTANCEGMSDQSTVEVPLEVVLYGANFRFNKDQLTPAGMDSVRAAADSLKKYPEIKVRLAGHADFVGTDAYNCNLSWRRVHTVHHALNSFGISDDRFTAIEGFGEAYPIPDDQVSQEWKDLNTRTHDKGKFWDRRVDITSAINQGMAACPDPTRKP